jgi:transcription-repair coupling factor (superfamily II helicase)
MRLEPTPADQNGHEACPRFVTQANPDRAFATFLRGAVEEGRRVVLAAAGEDTLKRLVRRAERSLGRAAERAADWAAVLDAPQGALLAMRLELPGGFVSDGVTVVAAADLFGSDRGPAETGVPLEAATLLESELRQGDVVVHLDYGLGVLGGLESVPAGDGGAGEAVRLTYKDDAKLLVPAGDLDRVWRYGSDPDAVTLDRLDGDAWQTRRAAIEAEVAEAAAALAEDAKKRKRARAETLEWPRRDYERFAAGFAFTETPDQARAIEETLGDLAAGRPMNRLVVGDVGYGKTEVALRAAAAVALAGKQVAIVAPTTVLVRQHLTTFARRFRTVGIEVAHLSRLTGAAEAKQVKQGLSDGAVRVVVGTHALISKTVRFKDLGLVVIDEEQRFGRAHKQKLRDLAKGVNLLTLTATPIPQTLQSAMVGLQELSLIATPPARRRPIRTFVTPFDAATVREALLRESRRGGQSFVVCPRIEDIGPMAARLAELVPELDTLVAHGKLPAAEIDDAMVRFADGDGDVLLATNIIESGLDVPRANTMLVWRADRFGLSQLHQLRGRVGRGRAQAFAYLMTAPDAKIGAATRKRLATLETLDRLGAGFAISARDLDQRGAGELLGDEQAGHVKLIGAGLYQHLLGQALRGSSGEATAEPPTLNVETVGRIPDDYVPEPDTRINLYARLARIADPDALDVLREEIEDRFGPLPEPVETLLTAARLKALCRRLHITRVDAGPKAIALTFGPKGGAERRHPGSARLAGRRPYLARRARDSDQCRRDALGASGRAARPARGVGRLKSYERIVPLSGLVSSQV